MKKKILSYLLVFTLISSLYLTVLADDAVGTVGTNTNNSEVLSGSSESENAGSSESENAGSSESENAGSSESENTGSSVSENAGSSEGESSGESVASENESAANGEGLTEIFSETIKVEDNFNKFTPVSIDEGKPLPKSAKASRSKGRAYSFNLFEDKSTSKSIDISEIETSSKADASPKTRAAKYGYDLYAFEGTINAANESSFAYPLWLADGETLQASLFSPTDVDYDLYLLAFDLNTGNLITTPVDFSSHANSSDTLCESVGVVNNTGADMAYALEVYAKSGYSTSETYTLFVSYSDTPDTYEPDQNAWTAASNELTGITTSTSKTTNVRTLNSPIDEDWFVVNVTNSAEMNALKIVSTNSNVTVELYATILDANNNVVLEKLGHSDDGTYHQALSGTTYLRVRPKTSDAVGNYSLTVAPSLKVAYVDCTVLNDGTPWTADRFTNPGDMRYQIMSGANVTVTFICKTASGAPAKNADMTGSWEIYDYAWNTTAPSYHTLATGTGADANGKLAVVKRAPVVYGEGVSGSYLRWDYSVLMRITFNDEIYYEAPIYLTTK